MIQFRRLWDLKNDRTSLYLCWDFAALPEAFGGGLAPKRMLRLLRIPNRFRRFEYS